MNALFRTQDSSSLLILRLALGIVMLPHGLQKTVGLFGGGGFGATMGYFTGQGMPAALAFLVILAESLGSLGLIVGFLTRVAALGIGSVMVCAILTVHWPNGFFMNWFGNQKGEGFEYHLLVIGMALALILGGGGKASIDGAIAESSR